MSLTEKLILLRKQKGLTQMDLAERLDVSRQAVSRWEVGSSAPSTDNLKVLSELYGVTVDYLLNDEQDGSNAQNKSENVCPKKYSVIFIGIISLLLVIGVVVCLLIFRHRGQEIVTPMGEMNSEVDDSSSAVSFTIGW